MTEIRREATRLSFSGVPTTSGSVWRVPEPCGTGGLGDVMEAASRGAANAGGLTVGILPGEDPSAANAFVRVPIATGLGVARNLVVVAASDVVIAVGGRYGRL